LPATGNHERFTQSLQLGVDVLQVLFTSDRNGKWEIFHQSIGSDNARPIVTPPSWAVPTEGLFTGIAGGALGAQTSPDGRWILYFANPDGKSTLLMKAPLAGGAPERVHEASPGATLGCSKLMGGSCVIAERTPDQKTIVFSALDPEGGRGRELARVDADPAPHPWALSQDGSAIAVHSERSNHFDLISTKTGRRTFLDASGWPAVGPVSWTSRGDGLFVSVLRGPDALIVQVDLNANARVIWRQTGDYGLTAMPSPDSRLLALMR